MELKYVWRQKDRALIKMPSDLRVGNVLDDLAAFFEKRYSLYDQRFRTGTLTDLDATNMFPHRVGVAKHRNKCLSTMEHLYGSNRRVYEATDYRIGSYMNKELVTKQLNQALMAPERLELCVGARVASCTKLTQDEVEIPNGTIGSVEEFRTFTACVPVGRSTMMPVVRIETVAGPTLVCVKPCDMKLQAVARDVPYACCLQVPLAIAWAMTVHRCRGLKMDAAVVKLPPCFVCGMVYAALSRVKTMSGVRVLLFDREKVRADPVVLSFYRDEL